MNASRVTLARIDAALTLATQPSPRTTASIEQENASPASSGQRSPSTTTCSGGVGKREQRAAHREQRRLQDVERIDLGSISPAHAEAQAPGADAARERLAHRRRQQLRIREPRNTGSGRKDDGRRDHRSCERPAAGLVDPGGQAPS